MFCFVSLFKEIRTILNAKIEDAKHAKCQGMEEADQKHARHHDTFFSPNAYNELHLALQTYCFAYNLLVIKLYLAPTE